MIRVNPAELKRREFIQDKTEIYTQTTKELGGIYTAIIITSDNEIIDGHNRVAAAIELNISDIPAIVIDASLEKQLRELGYTHNDICFAAVSYDIDYNDNYSDEARNALQDYYPNEDCYNIYAEMMDK